MNYLPQCAICKKPVDRMITHCDPITLKTTIVLECHGDRDEGTMSEHDWLLGDTISIVGFRTKRLTIPKE